MRSTDNHAEALPTGRWLAMQRELLSQTIGQVAKALNRNPSTIRSIERNNRVIPPGWSDSLREIGMQMPVPEWPSNMPSYFGEDLKRDMSTRAGMQHSRYWLSKQLCVTEEVVALVIRGNLVVPQDWLLKLAELGANVPFAVRMALYQSDSDPVNPAPETPDFSDLFSELQENEWSHAPRVTGPAAGTPTSRLPHEPMSHDSDKQTPTDAPSERCKPESISFQWSREEGLRLSLSTPVLEQIAEGLKELLILYQAGIKLTQNPGNQRAAEPSRG